jgi:hypothetical protein
MLVSDGEMDARPAQARTVMRQFAVNPATTKAQTLAHAARSSGSFAVFMRNYLYFGFLFSCILLSSL